MAGLALCGLRRGDDKIFSALVSVSKKQFHLSGWCNLRQERKLESVQNVSETVFYEEETGHDESDGTMEKRNKSRLSSHHRNIVHGKPPYHEPVAPHHDTIEYRRRMFGRYGMSSGVDPGVLWPTREELQEKLDYEKVAYPDSFHEMVARAKLKSAEELETMKMREEEINAKADKLEQWKRELKQRIEKKLMEAQAAKAKKERLLEEVRQHFGFKVDLKDQRFKDLLEQKEKEESKRAKAEKKKLKEAKMLARLAGTQPSVVASADTPLAAEKVN